MFTVCECMYVSYARAHIHVYRVCVCGEKMTTFGADHFSFSEAGSFISLGLTYLVMLNWLESTYLHQPKSEI